MYPPCPPRRGGPVWPPTPVEGTPQARILNKETQQEQIFSRERQRAGKISFFRFVPARRMDEAGKGQRVPKGNL